MVHQRNSISTMRLGGLVVVCAAVASAQTHVEGSGVAGATVQSGGTVSALSAVDLLLERSFGSTFVASAQLATQLLPSRTGQYAFVDLGSALRVRGRLSSWDDEVVFAELFPFGGRRVRPTFDAANAWGAPPRPSSVAPMLKVGAAWRGASIWAAVQGNEQLFSANVTLVRATGLVGGGVVLPLGFRSDLTLLFQDRGVVPWPASAGVAHSVLAAGGSARLGWEAGGGVGPIYDPATFELDPDRFSALFFRDRSETPRAASVVIEAGTASQNLADPVVPNSLRSRDFAGYLDFQARFRLAALRLFLGFRFQNINLLNFDLPGFRAYTALPRDAVTLDEYSGLAGVDFQVRAVGLTPGLTMRVVRPAAMKLSDIDTTVLVFVARDVFAALPPGERVGTRIELIGSLKFDWFSFLSAVALVRGTLDPKAPRLAIGVNSAGDSIRTNEQVLSFQLLVQVAF